MKKRTIEMVLATAVTVLATVFAGSLLTGCSSSDGEEEDSDIVIDYDKEYQVKYYSRPPYADKEQGYWYNGAGTKEGVFTRLIPNAQAPYHLLVCAKNEKGKRAIKHMAEQKDGVILQMTETGGDGRDHWFVTSTCYFECPDFFVSDNYSRENHEADHGQFFRVLPFIGIKLKEGASAKGIEKKYRGILTPSTDQYSHRIAEYNCNLNNSYEMLRLAAEISQRDDVEWAEADMYSPTWKD